MGQEAPIEEKIKWNKTNNRREELMALFTKKLPEFKIRSGGLTSIDIPQHCIDKVFGIEQIVKNLKITKDDMIFVGDSFDESGNDYPIKGTGVDFVEVSGPEDTKLFIRTLLKI